MGFRKQSILCVILFLLGQGMPFIVNQVYAETNGSIDEQALAAFRNQTPDYVAMSTAVPSVEEAPTAVQEFSFVEKTFQTVTNQPVILRFTSTYPADEVLVRVPIEGEVMTSHFSSGESITHSHGEYWTLHTKGKQTEFTLPVVFETPGQYFITIDHDADHFYLEVETPISDNNTGIDDRSQALEDTQTNKEKFDPSEENDEQKEEPQKREESGDVNLSVHAVTASEGNLSIPEEVIQAEEARILEGTRDTQNRSRSIVQNWSGFRSAWNSRSVTEIYFQSDITFSSSLLGDSLNVRSNSVDLTGAAFFRLNFAGSANSLAMSAGDLYIEGLNFFTSTNTSATTPLIRHSGSGTITVQGYSSAPLFLSYRNNTPVISLSQASMLVMKGAIIVSGSTHSLQSPVQLSGSSRLVLENGLIGSMAITGMYLPPISSSANSTIDIKGNNILMTGRVDQSGAPFHSSFSESWYSVDARLTGVNGSIVTSSISDPNDFSERYLFNFNNIGYRTIMTGAHSSDGFNPPRPSYVLSLEASPTLGGNPTAQTTTITQGETTTLHANPTETFDFLRWEIVSGTDSRILDETNEVTTFTMGTSDTTVRAVYQKKQGGDVLVKYLDESLAELAEPRILRGLLEEDYETEPLEIEGYTLKEMPENAKGRFTKEEQIVTYLYTKDVLDPVSPVDPLVPETEVDPENPPELPGEQGALSIDFASRFSFGKQGISAQTKNYYAQPQRLLNPDGTINAEEERPNYVQISDRRSESDRHGWTLSVTQNGQFINPQKHELKGSRLQLTNQQLASVQNIGEPELSQPDGIKLIPGEKTELITAKDDQGIGTWVYRFGDAASADKSVVLEVPSSTAPQAATYQTTLTWELSMVPDNQK
ncbi:WxL domain-containing protein [Enterococcus sp. DIV0806c]|uniref:WxL domain-containing protein n=1 Tax=Enterococcus sp. DIV0806c TaxID=2774869 RepID=UPI003F213DDD